MWTTQGGNISLAPPDAHFAIAELEGPSDYDSIMAVKSTWPTCPKAVVTNFSTIDATRAEPLVAAGFACLTECYLGELETLTPERLDFDAKQRGWDYSVPCFGIWNKPLSEYAEWQDWPQGWCCYLAEYLL